MDLKLMILRAVLDAKDILFGGFTSTLSKQDKRKKWEEIAKLCHSLGVIPAAKDYTYVRDAYWPNIKKATMAKIDNAKRTGSAGGKNKKLTAVDELVLEILGKNSPTVAGLHVVDTMNDVTEEPGTSSDIGCSVVQDEAQAIIQPSGESQETISKKRKLVVTEGSRKHAELIEITNLKKRKFEAEIENLKLQNYKLQLEIYEKEKKLNIKTSHEYSLPTATSEVLLLTDTSVYNEDGPVTDKDTERE